MDNLNLDCMDADDLMSFWNKHQGGRKFREILPAGGRGSKESVAGLADYASNKATAMYCRQRGDITGALQYEGICERIYATLPSSVTW